MGGDAQDQVRAYLNALGGRAEATSLFEVRARYQQSMRRRFYPVRQADYATDDILHLARERDVYVGAAPRACPRGGRDGITTVSTLWVDADTAESVGRLDHFEPVPSILISSGRGRHAYWLLSNPIEPEAAEDANRRLAAFLRADPRCADSARILRPPGTVNFGYCPPRSVELLRLDSRRLALGSLLVGLPAAPASRDTRSARGGGGDPLLALDPAFYVQQLLSVTVGRDRKISCPLHRDERPSLHVYATAERGWHCFSCGRGGSVYDLAAALWGVEARGQDFLRLRDRLRGLLLGGAT